MEFSVTYLLYRGVERFLAFWQHWYFGGSRYAAHRLRSIIYAIDKNFAVRITIRHFFEPLWGDYTIIGRILGPIFRAGRILIGGLTYICVAALWAVLLIFWYFLPPFLLAEALINH